MKYLARLGLILTGSLALAVWLTGCGDTNESRNNGGGGGGSTTTNAPTSIAGKSITHTITTGTPPFSNSGTFLLQLGGNPGENTGTFIQTGSGGVTNGLGTFTFTVTDANAGTLVLVDGASGQHTDENLIFQTPQSGTFSSSIPSGGTQTGTFTIN